MKQIDYMVHTAVDHCRISALNTSEITHAVPTQGLQVHNKIGRGGSAVTITFAGLIDKRLTKALPFPRLLHEDVLCAYYILT